MKVTTLDRMPPHALERIAELERINLDYAIHEQKLEAENKAQAATIERLLDMIEDCVKAESYGCGFSSNQNWIDAFDALVIEGSK